MLASVPVTLKTGTSQGFHCFAGYAAWSRLRPSLLERRPADWLATLDHRDTPSIILRASSVLQNDNWRHRSEVKRRVRLRNCFLYRMAQASAIRSGGRPTFNADFFLTPSHISMACFVWSRSNSPMWHSCTSMPISRASPSVCDRTDRRLTNAVGFQFVAVSWSNPLVPRCAPSIPPYSTAPTIRRHTLNILAISISSSGVPLLDSRTTSLRPHSVTWCQFITQPSSCTL